MKYLLALALVAVASAATLPEPLQLADPQAPVVSAPELLQPVQIADITPLMVPQEVMDEVALMVKFVDTAENVAPEYFAVNDSPVDTSDYTVHFVDEAVNADVPVQIRFMDPLPDSVVMPLGDIIYDFESAQPDASDDLAVKFVDVADVDEETPVYMPMARPAIEPSVEAVKIVESPQEASDDFKVNFVDIAEEAIPLGLPSDVEAEMVAPQEASDADLKVNFVDVAEETASYVPLSLPTDIEAGNVAPQEASDDFKVNFVDFAEETPSYIPLPLDIEAVKIVDSLPEMNDYTVKIVDVAEETFSKQYPDPRWR